MHCQSGGSDACIGLHRSACHYRVVNVMEKKQASPQPSHGSWETENLRLTAFPRDPERARECGKWKDMTGRDPEARQERPHERAVLEAGLFEPGWLTLDISPLRINWRYMVKPTEDSPPSELPIFGPFHETRKPFLRLMKRWLKTSPPLSRLAFGAILLKPVADRQEGYRVLDQLLPAVQIDPEGMRDFQYRVNRRRLSGSGIDALEINRLSAWSVALHSGLTLQVSPGPSRVVETGTASACRLELDINTVPEFTGKLKKSMLPKLFQELVDLGVEISEHGDQL